jgi:hypothetical protein
VFATDSRCMRHTHRPGVAKLARISFERLSRKRERDLDRAILATPEEERDDDVHEFLQSIQRVTLEMLENHKGSA